MPISRKNASRPNVRASSGIIGTMFRLMPFCRSKILNTFPKAVVVEISEFEPLKNSAKQSSFGTSSATGVTLRAGRNPPSAWRRSSRYLVSTLSGAGR